MQEDARQELLQMSEGQLAEVARVANRYPDIQLTYQLPTGTAAAAGDQVTLVADLERELDGDLRPVDAPRCARTLPASASRALCGSCSFIIVQ